MKSTGIIRRIDELGRIVIPKEIRKSMHIKEGENIEIFIDSDNIILRKFSMLKNISDIAQNLVDSLYNTLKCNIIITDTNTIISTNSKIKKDLIDKNLSSNLLLYINRKDKFIESNRGILQITDDFFVECFSIITPIFVNGDINGLLILYGNDNDNIGNNSSLISFVSNFFENYLSE